MAAGLMVSEAEEGCPWCAGFGMDAMTGEPCPCKALAGPEMGPESGLAPLPECGSARTGRRRRARNIGGTGGAGCGTSPLAAAGGKLNLRGFVAEAATHQGKPRRRRPVSIAEITGREESDGESRSMRVRSSPKVRFNPVVMECPFTPTNVAVEDEGGFGSLSSTRGEEERHSSGSSEESGDENAEPCCE